MEQEAAPSSGLLADTALNFETAGIARLISLQNKTPITIALTILTALRQINEVFNTDLHTKAKHLHVFLNLKEVDSLTMNSILKGKYAP